MPTALVPPQTPAGLRHCWVYLEKPGPMVPDPDGGYLPTWLPCTPPDVWARIRPASTRELDRLTSGTVITMATHIVTIPYHPEVTTESRVTYRGRVFSVIGPPANAEQRDLELDLICLELVDTGTPGRVV